jgi:hypothetical protein
MEGVVTIITGDQLIKGWAKQRESRPSNTSAQSLFIVCLVFGFFPAIFGGFRPAVLLPALGIAFGLAFAGMAADNLWQRRSESAAAHRRAVIAYATCSLLMMLYIAFASIWSIVLSWQSASSNLLWLVVALIIEVVITMIFAPRLTPLVFSHIVQSDNPSGSRLAASLAGLPGLGVALGLILGRTLAKDAQGLVLTLVLFLLAYMGIFFAVLMIYQLIIILRAGVLE